MHRGPDAPQSDAPQSDAPQSGAPQSGAPQSDAPQSDAPQSDAPQSDAPQSGAPQSDAPQSDAPQSDAPQPDAPPPAPSVPASGSGAAVRTAGTEEAGSQAPTPAAAEAVRMAETMHAAEQKLHSLALEKLHEDWEEKTQSAQELAAAGQEEEGAQALEEARGLMERYLEKMANLPVAAPVSVPRDALPAEQAALPAAQDVPPAEQAGQAGDVASVGTTYKEQRGKESQVTIRVSVYKDQPETDVRLEGVGASTGQLARYFRDRDDPAAGDPDAQAQAVTAHDGGVMGGKEGALAGAAPGSGSPEEIAKQTGSTPEERAQALADEKKKQEIAGLTGGPSGTGVPPDDGGGQHAPSATVAVRPPARVAAPMSGVTPPAAVARAPGGVLAGPSSLATRSRVAPPGTPVPGAVAAVLARAKVGFMGAPPGRPSASPQTVPHGSPAPATLGGLTEAQIQALPTEIATARSLTDQISNTYKDLQAAGSRQPTMQATMEELARSGGGGPLKLVSDWAGAERQKNGLPAVGDSAPLDAWALLLYSTGNYAEVAGEIKANAARSGVSPPAQEIEEAVAMTNFIRATNPEFKDAPLVPLAEKVMELTKGQPPVRIQGQTALVLRESALLLVARAVAGLRRRPDGMLEVAPPCRGDLTGDQTQCPSVETLLGANDPELIRYLTPPPEIVQQLEQRVGAYFGDLGVDAQGGLSAGLARYLSAAGPEAKASGVDLAELATRIGDAIVAQNATGRPIRLATLSVVLSDNEFLKLNAEEDTRDLAVKISNALSLIDEIQGVMGGPSLGAALESLSPAQPGAAPASDVLGAAVMTKAYERLRPGAQAAAAEPAPLARSAAALLLATLAGGPRLVLTGKADAALALAPGPALWAGVAAWLDEQPSPDSATPARAKFEQLAPSVSRFLMDQDHRLKDAAELAKLSEAPGGDTTVDISDIQARLDAL